MTQVEKVVQFLKDHPEETFTAKEIAEAIIPLYPEEYQSKRQNPRFVDERSFVSQVAAEIGAQKDSLRRCASGVSWQDRPKPRRYVWTEDLLSSSMCGDETSEEAGGEGTEDANEVCSFTQDVRTLTEHDLYPVLMQYLRSELHLRCLRINESRSSNTRGSGGNQWLHPDIVAMQPVDRKWDDLVRTCVQKSGGISVRLWSFEVKKEISNANVRKSFFQAVSNSSWAHEGYLVTTSISSDAGVEQELRMLSALHGIGVIVLSPENPSESEILLPATSRPEADWQSVNRLLVENGDFKEFIYQVTAYYQTGHLRERDWNR